jgi:hypothetical protein
MSGNSSPKRYFCIHGIDKAIDESTLKWFSRTNGTDHRKGSVGGKME